jgi:hypothetical protein
MSLLTTIIRGLIRLVPADDLDEVRIELDDCGQATAEQSPPPEPSDPDGIDWTPVWSALLDASGNAHRIAEQLSGEQVFIDFAEITATADQLREIIDSTYGLVCEASQLDGIDLDPGMTLRQLRRLVAVRRAILVDNELRTIQLTPAAGAPVWSIDYREHGGFVASQHDNAEDETTPWKFWGVAPTAESAAHVVRCYFLDRPPVIVFGSAQPDRPRPISTIGPESDLSLIGPTIRELLDRRGRVYDQHIAACQTARELLTGQRNIPAQLVQRAAKLNTSAPQLANQHPLHSIRSPLNLDHGGVADTVHWVPTDLVVATDHPTWGDFGGHRDDTPYRIIDGLLSNQLDDFTYELFTDRISLIRVPAWAGPIYRIGDNGNHRIHTARLLDLPWLAAGVEVEAIAPSWDMLSLIVADTPSGGAPDPRPLHEQLQERANHIAGLINRKIIDAELRDNPHGKPTLHCRYLPAAWLLRAPDHAAAVNKIYESRYPGALAQLNIPTDIGTDPTAWKTWLSAM